MSTNTGCPILTVPAQYLEKDTFCDYSILYSETKVVVFMIRLSKINKIYIEHFFVR